MVDDNEPASVDALTAQGGFLAQTGTSGADAASDLARRYRELQARYRGIIDRLPAVLYIDGVNDGDTMVDVGPGIVDLLGMTREEWLATSEGWRDVMHPGRPRPHRRGERADRRDRRAVPRAVPRDPSRRTRGVDPRRGDPRGRRGRQPAVLARPDARRHRHRSHRARAAGSADEVRRARRADPRDRLRGRRRRAHDHELRQPADRGARWGSRRRSTSTTRTCG